LKKKALLISLVMLLAISLVAIGCGPKEAPAPTTPEPTTPEPTTPEPTTPEPTTEAAIWNFKFSYSSPQTGIAGQQMQWWVNQVEKRSGGRIAIKPYWSASLHKNEDALFALQSGLTDITSIPAPYAPSFFPLTMLIETPGQSSDLWAGQMAAAEIQRGENEYLKTELEMRGIKPLGIHNSGNTHFAIFAKPMETDTIKDFKNKVIRVYGAGQTTLANELGAKPTPISYNDIYEAMARGTIDCANYAIGLSDPLKHYEVTDTVYHLVIGAAFGSPTSMRISTFNGLPEDLQTLLWDELFWEWIDRYSWQHIEGPLGDQILLAKWADYGCKIVEPSEEDLAIFAVAVKNTQKVFVEQTSQMPGGEHAQDVWDDFQARCRIYEQVVATEGHPWERGQGLTWTED